MTQSRRRFLSLLLAAPAICRSSSLMALQGVLLDPIVRLQTWKPDVAYPVGEWEVFEGPLSQAPQLLRTQAFLVEPKLPKLVYSYSGGRSDPNAPLIPCGSSVAKWIGGIATDAVRNDFSPSPLALHKTLSVASYKGGHVWLNQSVDEQARQISFIDNYIDNYNRHTNALSNQLATICQWGK